ncbi:MAG: hypothetical protein U0Q07_08795 [Acidimicrobiales bacterium]
MALSRPIGSEVRRARGRLASRLVRIAAPAVALVALATACLPAFRGPSGGPRSVLFGDSLLFTADYDGKIDPAFDAVGWQRSVVSGIGVSVSDHRALIGEAPNVSPKAVLLAHGTTEANRAVGAGINAGASMAKSRSDLVGAVDALAAVPCVILVNVNQHGGTPAFNDQAAAYNLAILVLDVQRANVRALDWNGLSIGHPDWFADDGVHFTAAGDIAYATALAGAVAAC